MNAAADRPLKPLGKGRIMSFWWPLLATWLMMAAEGPFVSAIMGRLDEAKYNLAAHGVAFSLALLAESPIIMLLSASTALVRDRASYLRLRNFTFILMGLVVALMLVVAFPPVFDHLSRRLIGLPDEVASLAQRAITLMIPWPAAIGYRRFYNGIMIRHNRTLYVTVGTVTRLVIMVAVGLTLYSLGGLPGAVVSAISLTACVIVEAVLVRYMADGLVKALPEKPPAGEAGPGWAEIMKFYLPLALTSIIALGVHPFITFLVGQSRQALESLAVLPVVNALVFLFLCAGFSFQEVGIALLGEGQRHYRPLRNFAAVLAGSTILAMAIISLTPLADAWFLQVANVTPDLAALGRPTLMIYILVPAAWVFMSLQRSVLVNVRRTAPITLATLIEVSVILAALYVGTRWLDLAGAIAVAMAVLMGRLASNAYLMRPFLAVLSGSTAAR